jgi:hypothetical protein
MVGGRPAGLDGYFRCEMALYVCMCEIVYMCMYLCRFTPRRQPVRYFRHDQPLGRFSTRIFEVMVLCVYSASDKSDDHLYLVIIT